MFPCQADNAMNEKVVVYYDGACPECVKDRCWYEKLAGAEAANVDWFDITGQEEQLREMGIDPHKALTELHVKDENQCILSELDAYILLMRRVPRLRPLAWLISLSLVRPSIAKFYHWQVTRRLQRTQRI